MSVLVVLRPNATFKQLNSGGYTFPTGGLDPYGPLVDNDDNTGIGTDATGNGGGYPYWEFLLSDITLPASSDPTHVDGARIEWVRQRVRVKMDTSGTYANQRLPSWVYAYGGQNIIYADLTPVRDGVVHELVGPRSAINIHTNDYYNEADVNALTLAFQMVDTSGSPSSNTWLSEAYFDVSYRRAGSLTIDSPTTGSFLNTARPTITWTPSAPDNITPQAFYELRVYTYAQYTAGGFDPWNPVAFPAIYDSGQVASTATSHTLGNSLPAGQYRVYVWASQPWITNKRWWTPLEYVDFSVNQEDMAPPVVTATVDNPNARIDLLIEGAFNIVSPTDYNLEGSIGSWRAITNCTINNVVPPTAPPSGSKVLELTTSAAGTAKATTGAYAVVAGNSYNCRAQISNGTAARSLQLVIDWLDNSFAVLSSSTSAVVTPAATTWVTGPAVTAVAPVGAHYAAIGIIMAGATAAGEHCYLDRGYLSPSTGAGFQGPGTYGFFDTAAYFVERSIDAGATWNPVNLPVGRYPNGLGPESGAAVQYDIFTDYEAPPGIPLLYRVTSYFGNPLTGLSASVPSAPTASVQQDITDWWLKDTAQPLNNTIIDVLPPFNQKYSEQSATYQPLGRSTPVIVSDSMSADNGELKIETIGPTEFAAVRNLVKLQRKLLLQSPFDPTQWYIRITGDRTVELPGYEAASAIRTIAVSYAEVRFDS